jgi:putative acetyltransferase
VTVCIGIEAPDQPEIVRLIEALDAYQVPLYPPESHHGIDIAALAASNVVFAVARVTDGSAVGCAAIVLGEHYGELKRMYVRPEVRGRGIGRALLAFLEREAVARGCTRLTLETGFRQHEALGLYARCGYGRCGPFGHYVEDPNSVFMCKDLA